MKLNKVDDKTAYENLLVEYAELENKIADIKANCDLAIEGRDVKIMELEEQIEKMKCCSLCENYNMNYLPYWCKTNCVPMQPYEKCKCWELRR